MGAWNAKLQKCAIEHVVYPMMERRRGNRVRAILSELAASAVDGSALDIQRERLKSLLHLCAERVPAYRELGLTAEAIDADPYACLRERVPLLSKQDFRQSPDRYLTEGIPAERRIANKSGGSTGLPLEFYMDRPQVEAYEAARWRALAWYGITPGSRNVRVQGGPLELDAQGQASFFRRERLLKNRIYISAYALSPDSGAEYCRMLNRTQPEYLYGYPTALTALVQILRPHKAELHLHLKAVVTSSETLFDWQRELLEDTFSCPVANEYGARDAGILAYDCPDGHLHLTAENLVLEVLDPETLEPVPDGERGVVAVTDLGNTIQPRLRYLLGDVVSFDPDPGDCRIKLPVLRHVEGREDALLVRGDGKLVHGNAFNTVLRSFMALRQYQLVQHSREKATLYLAMDPDPELAQKALEGVRRTLPGVEIELSVVESIPPAPSGKYRYAIREFPL